MPPHRSGLRRHRRELIARSQPPCVEDDATSLQKPQAASSITATSSSWPQSQTLGQGTTDVPPPSESSVPRVLARLEFDWGYTVYIRLDLQGYFHTYPDLGGPYQSLQEADKAIDRHLDELRDPKMFMQQDGVSSFDIIIRQNLYWPDGTSRYSKSCAVQKSKDQKRRLVQALLDKYNEDHHLLGDRAYKLNLLRCNPISEHKSWYYHLNFSAHSKAPGDSDNTTSNLFFAEVKHLNRGKHREVFVCCFCIVNPLDEGQHCNACTFHGDFDMKHPDSSVELAAGHSDPRSQQFGGLVEDKEWNDSEDEDACLRDAEAELRETYKGLDDPRVIESLFTFPPEVTIVQG